MQTPKAHPSFGDVVAASYDIGSMIAPDSKTAAVELAARHLERVLVRGSNLRLLAALANLAREFGPARAPLGLPGALESVSSSPERAAVR